MFRSVLTMCLCFVLIGSVYVSSSGQIGRSSNGTSLIRELAKHQSVVLILTSGPSVMEQAEELANKIRRHPDFKNKPENVILSPISDADKYIPADMKKAPSVIWLIATKEWKGELSSNLKSHFPGSISGLDPGSGFLKCETPTPGTALYDVAAVAPDRERLKLPLQQLLSKTATDYKRISFYQIYRTYKLATFSAQEDKDIASNWGHVTTADWTDYKWFPLSERDKMKDEALAEYNQAIFINRANKEVVIPNCAAKLLGDANLKPTSLVVKREKLENGCNIALFNMPSLTLMKAKAERYRSFDSIPGGLVAEDVKDLRNITRTTLLINGVKDPTDREAIRLELANDMRSMLKMNIEERGDILNLLHSEVTLQELQGSTGTSDLLRRKGLLRYVWIYSVLENQGSTTYDSGVNKISEQSITPYEQAHGADDPEPVLQRSTKGNPNTIAKENKVFEEIYDRAHIPWAKRKADYEERQRDRLTAVYSRTITKSVSSNSRGILQLVDLQDKQAPIEILWETKTGGSAATGAMNFLSDTVTVRADTQPSSLRAPANMSECTPELARRACVSGAKSGIKSLQETALLPDGSAPLAPVVVSTEPDGPKVGTTSPPVEPPKPPTPPSHTPPVQPDQIMVAEVLNNVVIINAGTTRGIKVGDRAQVVTVRKKILDPATGKEIEDRVIETITLKVVAVGEKTADCIAVSPAEVAKLSRVKTGLFVKSWHPANLPGGSGKKP